MNPEPRGNLLVNPSLDEGEGTPAGWEWVVERGSPVWEFDEAVRFVGKRSVRILQDGHAWLGEFRQMISCRGGGRYRVSARIKVTVDGSGSQSGASVYLRSFAGDRQIHDMWFRPFFVGLEDWRRWSAEYVTPPQADRLLVSFDMRNSCGVAWFDDLAVCEVPEPLARHAPLAEREVRRAQPARRAQTVALFSDGKLDWFRAHVLTPLVGEAKVTVPINRDASLADVTADAVIVDRAVSFDELIVFAESRVAVVTPAALTRMLGDHGVRCRTVRRDAPAPCLRIEVENFLTQGFRKRDILPWWTDPDDTGTAGQVQVVDEGGTLARLGFVAVGSSFCGEAEADGLPLVLCRPGDQGGGIVVMDLEALNHRPGLTAEANLVCLLLTNALGRPQTFFGAYVVPGHGAFDYDRFCAELEGLSHGHRLLALREVGRSGGGLPILSLSLGPQDAPTFYVDCAIHSDEWAPAYGTALYAAHLARELEEGKPWARALLSDLRLECIPVLSPDGWDNHVRFIRQDVDLNRNFPVYWDESTGRGKGPGKLSEPEARVVDEILRTRKVIAAVNWHETTANTNWVGTCGMGGRYRKYVTTAPGVFCQLIDGRTFCWQAATWTQITEPRNFHYHLTDSFPYMRDYSPQRVGYELFHADSLGIDGLTIEQYGNSDTGFVTSPQRTDITGIVIEMLFGLQIGLVCRNYGSAARRVRIPLEGDGLGRATVYGADGRELARPELRPENDRCVVETELPPAACLLVQPATPPWKRRV